MEEVKQKAYRGLEDLSINYEKYDHPPVFTADEASKHLNPIDADHVKNLFLRNRRGNAHYLVIVPVEKRADLKTLAENIGEPKLLFASPERLKKYLNVSPGSVSPLGLINDIEKHVKVFVNKELLEKEKIGFHPNINTGTVVISSKDFLKFLDSTGNEINFFE